MQEWGCGGLNIDASRIAGAIPVVPQPEFNTTGAIYNMKTGTGRNGEMSRADGRFPANLVLSHNDDCEDVCSDGCAVAALDEQSGELHLRGNIKETTLGGGMYGHGEFRGIGLSESGHTGASRFFYVAKASKSERNAGLGCEGICLSCQTKWRSEPGDFEHICVKCGAHMVIPKGEWQNPPQVTVIKNHHPTVKPQKLMQYLIKLITPPGGTVLDPFMGSGSTGVAAKALGFNFLGIEKEADYFEIAKARIDG